MQCVENCDDPNPRNHVLYEQPVWQTLQMFRTSSPLFLPVIICLNTVSFLVGEMLCRFLIFFLSCSHLRPSWDASGFLPVLYGGVSKWWRGASIRLPEEDSDSSLEELSESHKLPPRKLKGRRVLLLWFPALCDLTGTTVRDFSSLRYGL